MATAAADEQDDAIGSVGEVSWDSAFVLRQKLLVAVSRKQYETALRVALELRQHDASDAVAAEYARVLGEKVQLDAEAAAEAGADETSEGSDDDDEGEDEDDDDQKGDGDEDDGESDATATSSDDTEEDEDEDENEGEDDDAEHNGTGIVGAQAMRPDRGPASNAF
ncbi:hypothetical protein HK405_014173 [Cladochytrium tenue]|nr:hypothetical protein HK405_014173 [Cladochytrium tenue]